MASGAEHQFSHLWDMEHHTHNGDAPSHGFKVGIATLAVARLYEALYDVLPETLDVDRAVAQWPTWDETAWSINQLFEIDELRDKALEETKAKYVSPEALREQLVRYNAVSGKLKTRLREYLPAARLMEQMLRDVGAPTKPEQIGIPPARLRDSYLLAYHIRRRFTVLDLAVRAGVLDACLATVFAPQEAS